MLRIMSTWGGDQQLAAEAKTMADKWLNNHSAIDPNLVVSVLETAAFYGDKAFFDRLADSLKDTKDRQEREHVISAMERFRDPAAINAGFDALLTDRVPFMEGYFLLFGGQSSEATRTASLNFLKAHFDEILAKRPTGGGFDFGSVLPYVGGSYCNATDKAALKDFFEPRVDKLLGARRNLNQVLETIDVCIAQSAQQTPSVAAFLSKY
jgi:alanyl aminopeptidase